MDAATTSGERRTSRLHFEAEVERKLAVEFPDEGNVEGHDMVDVCGNPSLGLVTQHSNPKEVYATPRLQWEEERREQVQYQHLIVQGHKPHSQGARRHRRIIGNALIL